MVFKKKKVKEPEEDDEEEEEEEELPEIPKPARKKREISRDEVCDMIEGNLNRALQYLQALRE